MAGYIGTQAVSVNTTSATISDDLAVGDDATVAGDATVTGVITGSTVEATGDTAAGDNAAMGYTAAEGLILTGQGSTNDVTIKNDADADVIEIPTGTVNVTMAGLVTLPQLAITHDSNADTVTLTRTANDDNNILKFVTGSTNDWIVGERNDSSSDFRFYSYGTSGNVLSIARSNGAVTMAQGLTLTDGDLVFGTSGHGICLGATSATAANTLHDYEEGTHTMVSSTGGGGAGTNSAPLKSTYNLVRYTKIGQTVTIQGQVQFGNVNSPSGNLQFTLPFTMDTTDAEGSNVGGGCVRTYNGTAVSGGLYLWGVTVYNLGAIVQVDWVKDGATTPHIASSNEYLIFSFSYITSA